MAILPTSNRNDKSLIYLNGKILHIFLKNSGKNGIGNVKPDKISARTIIIFIIPFSSSVIKQMVW